MATQQKSEKKAERVYKLHGTIRDQFQQPLAKATVRVYNKTSRTKHALAEVITDADGEYSIDYSLKNAATAAIVVVVYEKGKKPLQESGTIYHVPVQMQVDISLSGQSYRGPAEYDQLLEKIAPYTEETALGDLTETDKHQDISFVAAKTQLAQEQIGKMIMAARFETYSAIPAYAWYGMLSQGLPSGRVTSAATTQANANFEDRREATFDRLMHIPSDIAINAIQSAINNNIVAAPVSEELGSIQKKFDAQLLSYAKAHPVTGEPSSLYQKLEMAGLKGKELHSYLDTHMQHKGTAGSYWAHVEAKAGLKEDSHLEKIKAVFTLSMLTNDNLPLTENLLRSEKIASSADISRLAGFDHKDWEAVIKEHKIKGPADYPAQLETIFTTTYPTAAFAARLKKDGKSNIAHREKVSKFLEDSQHFDLLRTPVGKFMKENKHLVADKDAPAVADQLRRLQRIFKLAPNYNAARTLLNDDIHSANQINKMGKDNFVAAYGQKLGEAESAAIFDKANMVHENAMALVGNLKSMADASSLNAFPNFNMMLAAGLAPEIPSLDTLFGHTDFCDCQECSSVYGAPAYLTDILHYLDQRLSTLDMSGGRKPTVKDILLSRRPDIADIDLQCDNTNIEIPYIDIACELMEDHIAPVTVSLAASLLPKIVHGRIDASLMAAINTAFAAAGMTNLAGNLTAAATVSAPYSVKRLQADNSFINYDHWVIRDATMVLRASNTGSANPVEIRLLHQTLLPADTISAGPEYVNINAYNTLKTATAPFTLPFDLFETESRLYLDKAGVSKPDLMNIFTGKGQDEWDSQANVDISYARLGISQAEQALIFQADPAHQTLYWGSAASSTTMKVSVFEQLTGLTYAQVLNLLHLRFINPANDTVIQHDAPVTGSTAPAYDTTKQSLINLTPAKLDAIHRFLRIWKKTSLTMDELDAIVMQLNGGNVNSLTPFILQYFTDTRTILNLSAFELLAFYGPVDTYYPDCLYNRLFQNNLITNPLDANLSIASVSKGTTAATANDKAALAAILQIDVSSPLLTDAFNLTMPVLSQLFRNAKLAQCLGISEIALQTLIQATQLDPFTDWSTTYGFIQKYKLIQSSGFSMDEVNYVLNHIDDADHTLIPSIDKLNADLQTLQNELIVVHNTTTAVADPNGTLLTSWLSDPVLNWDAGLAGRLLDILATADDDQYHAKIAANKNFLFNLRQQYDQKSLTVDLSALPLTGTPPAAIAFPDALTPQVSFDAATHQLVVRGVLSVDDLGTLSALSQDTAYLHAVQLLSGINNTDDSAQNVFFSSLADVITQLDGILSNNIAARYALFVNKLAPTYQQLKQRDVLVKNISTFFHTDKSLVVSLLTNIDPIYSDLTATDFLNKVEITGNPGGSAYPVQANRYQHVAKVCLVIGKLKLTKDALDAILSVNSPVGVLSLADLPAIPASVPTDKADFGAFKGLIEILRFDQYHPVKRYNSGNSPARDVSVFSILLSYNDTPFDTDGGQSLATQLSWLTGWDYTQVHSLAAQYFPASEGSWQTGANLLRIHQGMNMLQQLGATYQTVTNWCKPGLTVADSTLIKQTLKAKLNSADWLDFSKPLQDTLREKKRDALIAYLLANPGAQNWASDNDLYSYFLLDVEMCSCQPTSRIVQATNSVQLFVQRCFLGLEANIIVRTKPDARDTAHPPDTAWLQWSWMKNFRVWQANVKVFLYPENWIEPELLPDSIKSSFLKDLENELLQTEVTANSAEDAYYNYLQKLNGVARLEVKAMWYDYLSRTLHVFARNFGGEPRQYYYRQFVNDKRWTPWTKVDLDISGDHIATTFYNNRLYIFWAIISTQPDMNNLKKLTIGSSVNDYEMPQPDKNWLVQLAFSEFRNGKWLPKVVSPMDAVGTLTVPIAQVPDKAAFVLTALDIPAYDYSSLYKDGKKQDALEVFNSKISGPVSTSGKLVISLYKCTQINNQTTANLTYLNSWQLNPVKGYPTQLNVPYLAQQFQASFHPERQNKKSQMINMLDVQKFDATSTPPTTGIPGANSGGILVAEQGGGSFASLIPIQMGLDERYIFAKNIYDNGISATIQLKTSLGQFLPYFYQDQRRSYYVVSEYSDNASYEYLYSQYYDLTMKLLTAGANEYNKDLAAIRVAMGLEAGDDIPWTSRYFNFHHPLVDFFITTLFQQGIDGFMDRTTQLKGDFGYDKDPNKFSFQNFFQPVFSSFATVYSGAKITPPVVHDTVTDPTPGYPKDNVDFSLQSGYGLYNWELFFHAPLMIAERLSQNQQFDDAERWYRYIFNPMDTSTFDKPSRYWNTQPFFLTTNADYANQQIDRVLAGINSADNALVQDVADWRMNPFQPHFIAQYRTVAYQKTVVMKYVGHLIRHGDFLFTQQTMESVNEATQLYILAAEILGPKPELLPSPVSIGVDNYYQLEGKLDAMSDALVDVENLMPYHTIAGYTGTQPGTGLPALRTLYFNIPMNENLIGPTGYWDTVADRLFKIRHCLNIDGTFAPLSLFSPAIDPGALVRAAAAGLDLGSVLNDMNGPLPVYRFMVMIQKAAELTGEVKNLGAALLSALEKKDSETLMLLRADHELKMQTAILEVKKKQLDESKSALENLKKQKLLSEARHDYYDNLILQGWTLGEEVAYDLNILSATAEAAIFASAVLSGVMGSIPTFVFGASGLGSPVATAADGGVQLKEPAMAIGRALESGSRFVDKTASLISTASGFGRRADEWKFQRNLASLETNQVIVQIEAATIRIDIAQKDLDNQELAITQTRAANDFMSGKYTNQELYNWMVTQISSTYFKSYQLAYDVARRAERSLRYELGLDDSSYINFGYWDSLKKGLLAGEQLSYDIRRMEMAFYEQNKRELELTKPVSLALLDPAALLTLKTSGACWINLPEEVFDMDYPGHYMRRIRSVSVTIPCIAGPYTAVSCKLTMTRNTIRTSGVTPASVADYPRKTTGGMPADDSRFRDSVGALQSIATSTAQNDSGLFELSFRDERYLPFEGAGAISQWHLELPSAVKQFNWDSISDVIIHIRYTARDGGQGLSNAATTSLATTINNMVVSLRDKGLMRMYSAKNDLPTEWYRFLNPTSATDDQVLNLNLEKTRFPLFAQAKTIKITSIEIVADISVTPGGPLRSVSPAGVSADVTLAPGAYNNMLNATVTYSNDPGVWQIRNPGANRAATDGKWNNMIIIVHYTVQ